MLNLYADFAKNLKKGDKLNAHELGWCVVSGIKAKAQDRIVVECFSDASGEQKTIDFWAYNGVTFIRG